MTLYSKLKDKMRLNEILPILICLFVVLTLVTLYVKNFGCSSEQIFSNDWVCFSQSKGDWGVTGDFFGGILNPLLSFVTIYYVYKTYKGESQNKKNFAIEHIFSSIEKMLEERSTAPSNEVDIELISGRDTLILLSRLSKAEIKDEKEIQITYLLGCDLMVWMRTQLALYISITSDLDQDSRKNLNMAFICHFQQPAIAFGLAQYLVLDHAIQSKGGTIARERNFEDRIIELIFETYIYASYESADVLLTKFRKYALKNWEICSEAKKEWRKEL